MGKKKSVSSQTVLAQLMDKYGKKQVDMIERLSEGVYRAKLTDGSIVAAFVTTDGEIVSRMLEAVGA